jgi:L-lactate utilization protein LutC
MTTPRESFLQRVREAVTAGNRPGAAGPLPDRGNVGYQGAGPDPVARFRDELTAVGGHFHLVPDREAAAAKVIEIVRGKAARQVLLGRGAFLDTLALPERLGAAGVTSVVVDALSAATSRDPFFAAEVGISGADFLLAETGSVALLARPGEPRSLSLLPPVHLVVARRADLHPDLFDLFVQFARRTAPAEPGQGLPACLSLITGPSKTGDIELRLVTGVHGPGEVHVVLVDA